MPTKGNKYDKYKVSLYILNAEDARKTCAVLRNRKVKAVQKCRRLYSVETLSLHFDRQYMYSEIPISQLENETKSIIEMEAVGYYICNTNSTYFYGPDYFLNKYEHPVVERAQFRAYDPIPQVIQDAFAFAVSNEPLNAFRILQYILNYGTIANYVPDERGPLIPAIYLLRRYRQILDTHSAQELRATLPSTIVRHQRVQHLFDFNRMYIALGYDCQTLCARAELFATTGPIKHSIKDLNRELDASDLNAGIDTRCIRTLHIAELKGTQTAKRGSRGARTRPERHVGNIIAMATITFTLLVCTITYMQKHNVTIRTIIQSIRKMRRVMTKGITSIWQKPRRKRAAIPRHLRKYPVQHNNT